MSTRWQISAKLSDGRYGCIYVHGNGSPKIALPILQSHYTDPAKIDALIALGDCLAIRPDIAACEPFSAHEDEKWDDIKPHYAETAEAAAEAHKHGDEDYLYVFDGAAWRVEELT